PRQLPLEPAERRRQHAPVSSIHWRVPGPFYDLDVLRARDATPDQRGDALPPAEAARALDAACESPWSAEAMRALLPEILLDFETRHEIREARERLVRMLLLGTLIALRVERGALPDHKTD